MHIKEPATLEMEAQFSLQSSEAVPNQEPLSRAIEELDVWKDSPTALQQALLRYQKREQLFNLLRKRIHSCSQLEPLLQFTLAQVRQLLQSYCIIIYRYKSDGGDEIAFDSVDKPLKVLRDLHIQDRSPQENLFFPVSSAHNSMPIRWNISGNLAVPILLKQEYEDKKSEMPAAGVAIANRLWGLLIVYDSSHSRQWERWEIEFLEQISLEIAIAIQQSQLGEQVQTQKEQRQFAQTQAQEISQQLKISLKQLESTQQQLLQNEKMANLGQLMADMTNEIHHPVNFIYTNLHPASQYAEDLIKLIELYQYYYPTPTAIITSHLQQLDLDWIKTDLLKLLWSMRSGSERLKEIIFAVQNFSSVDEDKMKKANLHEGLDTVLRILQHRLKEQPNRPGIEIIKEFGQLPLVECYSGELNQVFMNILTNAIDALEQRMKYDYSFLPKIWIRTEIISSHLSLISSNEVINTGKKVDNKHKVIIHITDNGQGILPHIQRHIFEPFFTTKTVGKSKGLGLSVSQQIVVEKHHGKLKCNSQVGQGTEFIIEMNTRARRYTNIKQRVSF